MKNKTLKIVATVIMAMFVLSFASQIVFADAKSVVNGITITEPTDTDGLQVIAGKVIGLMQVASAVLAVVLIAVFGFKFILGSANEKADYQKSFIPLIVGVVVVFAATSIAKLIFSTFS